MNLRADELSAMDDERLAMILKSLVVACPLGMRRTACPLWSGHASLMSMFDAIEAMPRALLLASVESHQECLQQVPAREPLPNPA